MSDIERKRPRLGGVGNDGTNAEVVWKPIEYWQLVVGLMRRRTYEGEPCV